MFGSKLFSYLLGARASGRSALHNSPPIGASPLGVSLGHAFGASPFRPNSVAGGTSAGTSSLYDFISGANMSPSSNQESTNSVVHAAASILQNNEIQRLKEELAYAKGQIEKYSEIRNIQNGDISSNQSGDGSLINENMRLKQELSVAKNQLGRITQYATELEQKLKRM